MFLQLSWKVRKSVFSPISLTEGLRPRPSWHASSVQQKNLQNSKYWNSCQGSTTIPLYIQSAYLHGTYRMGTTAAAPVYVHRIGRESFQHFQTPTNGSVNKHNVQMGLPEGHSVGLHFSQNGFAYQAATWVFCNMATTSTLRTRASGSCNEGRTSCRKEFQYTMLSVAK